MPANLTAKIDRLRRYRVDLRKQIEALQRQLSLSDVHAYGPDGSLNRIARLRCALRGTEDEWTGLHDQRRSLERGLADAVEHYCGYRMR